VRAAPFSAGPHKFDQTGKGPESFSSRPSRSSEPYHGDGQQVIKSCATPPANLPMLSSLGLTKLLLQRPVFGDVPPTTRRHDCPHRIVRENKVPFDQPAASSWVGSVVSKCAGSCAEKRKR